MHLHVDVNPAQHRPDEVVRHADRLITFLDQFAAAEPDCPLGRIEVLHGAKRHRRTVPHRRVVNRLAWMQDRFGVLSSDRVLLKTPVVLDPSIGELFWSLATGAMLVVACLGGHRDPDYLAEFIRRLRCRVVWRCAIRMVQRSRRFWCRRGVRSGLGWWCSSDRYSVANTRMYVLDTLLCSMPLRSGG